MEVTAPVDWLRSRVSRNPGDLVLLAPGGNSVECQELWRESEAIARTLKEAGARRGSVAAIAMTDSAELIAALFGATAAAACAPLNPSLAAAEFDVQFSRLGVQVLLTDSLDSCSAAVARSRGIPVVEYRWGRFQVEGQPATGRRLVNDDVVLVLQTSATTGEPKVAPISVSNLHAMVQNSTRSLQLTARDRFLSLMPLFHLQGLIAAVMQIACGGVVIPTKGFDARKFLSWLDECRPTWYTAVPALHRTIATLLREQKATAPPGLRFVRSIGAALPADLLAEVEETLRVPVIEGYGLTETGAVTTSPLPPLPRKPGSAGISNFTEFTIFDETGIPAPAGVEGEICVRGASVIREYIGDAEANRRAFVNGWFRTGDLGRVDSDGYLFVTGRIKEIINRGGEKIHPQEIDSVLAAHSGVAEAAAFGMPHASLGEDVGAAVVLRPGAAVTEAELREFAATRLAAFKIPRRIFIGAAIPKGATGKARRHLLPQHVRPSMAEPSSPTERTVAGVWSRILKSPEIGIDDDFFMAGGDSLAVTVMMIEVERETGGQVAPEEFFAKPTIRAMARLVDDLALRTNRVLTFRHRGAGTPFFCLAGATEDCLGLRYLAESLGEGRAFHVLRDPRPPASRGVYTVEEVAALLLPSLRAVQPQGPYLLGGHCYGGIVAFEMARRLAEAGEATPLVVLMNVPTPGFPRIAAEILHRRKRYWREFLRAAGGERGAARSVLTNAVKLGALLKRRAARNIRLSGVGAAAEKLLPAAENVNDANTRAARTYTPGMFPGKVVQFMSAEGGVDTAVWEDSRFGWREFAANGFEHYTVPGTHTSMLAPPNVSAIAERLAALLAAIDSGNGGALSLA